MVSPLGLEEGTASKTHNWTERMVRPVLQVINQK